MEPGYKRYVDFPGRILIVGFGSIGTGTLPLILRHVGIPKERISIITADKHGAAIAKKEGVRFRIQPLTKKNYRGIIDSYLSKGDFLINLSVYVGSVDIMEHCQKRGILYLDTVVDGWEEDFSNSRWSLSQKSNYGFRERMLALRKKQNGTATAISAHGANPGIVSHFVKQALLNVARDTGLETETPRSKESWARLMRRVGVRVIHIAEYDSQVSREPKKLGRFENTWSIDGFFTEGISQPCELGWGTHEKYWPKDAHRHGYGSGAGIYLDEPSATTLVRTWTPAHGTFFGRVITHSETITIADYFTIRDGRSLAYRPTVNYAYRPCDVAILSAEECIGNHFQLQKEKKILLEEIESGMDELGVLLMGHKKGAYWYGSQLTIEETRKLAPYQNATTLQVSAGVLGGVIWAMENPHAGIVEADEMDFKRVMEIVKPYMGKMVGKYTDWTPLKPDNSSFVRDVDRKDPWQFKNFRFA
jgi:homospermidine synthase